MKKDGILVKIDPELADIVPGYLENRKKGIAIMKEALSSKNFKTLETLGHQLKGNAGGYGFDDLGPIGATIETSAKAGNVKQIELAIDQMEDYLSRVEIVYE